MLENICTSRRGSLSTLASGVSDDLGIGFEAFNLDDGDHNPITPASPLRKSHVSYPPLRERFGSGMTIVAATSPEIKALNLPSTPAFPPTRLDFNRSSSFSCTPSKVPSRISQPALHRAASMGERIALCIDTMDDVEDPSFPSPPTKDELTTATSSFYHDDEEDDLLRIVIPNKVPYHPDENKENIHPNLIQQQSEKASSSPLKNHKNNDDDPSLLKKKKSHHGRRTSFHRRISYESLPSPAEIGPSPLSHHKVVQANSNVFHFSLPNLDELAAAPHRHHTNPVTSIRMPAKSLQLSTGFR
jgi:hypothetical protein